MAVIPVCSSLAISLSAAAVLRCIPARVLGCVSGWACPGLERAWLKCNFTKWPLPQIFLSMERVKASYLSRDVSPISATGLVWAAAPEPCWKRAGGCVTLLGCSQVQTFLCLCSCSLLRPLPGLWGDLQPSPLAGMVDLDKRGRGRGLPDFIRSVED